MKNATASIQRDVLTEMLQPARFRGTVLCRTEFTAPWGFAVAGRDFATFHVVMCGRCCLEIEGVGGRTWLSEGDLVVLPHGSAHVVRDAPTSPVTRLEDLIRDGDFDDRGTLHSGGGGKLAVLACGGFYFEDALTNPLLDALPPVMRLEGRSRGVDRWFQMTTKFLAEELESPRPGADTVVTRLAEILFVEAIRAYFSSHEAKEKNLAVALKDPRIGTAIALIHREPERPWSVEALALRAGMSRTTFAIRFTSLVGESPLRYVARCRMTKAIALLRSSRATIPDIAGRVGYASEIAFGRAFKRYTGETPAAFRANDHPPDGQELARGVSKRNPD